MACAAAWPAREAEDRGGTAEGRRRKIKSINLAESRLHQLCC